MLAVLLALEERLPLPAAAAAAAALESVVFNRLQDL